LKKFVPSISQKTGAEEEKRKKCEWDSKLFYGPPLMADEGRKNVSDHSIFCDHSI
jgi:hypothetical protein